MTLQGKTIVLGVTGSIAIYKAVDLASKLTQQEARVDVTMTPSATRFVTPLTFRSVTGRPVTVDMFDTASEFSVEHIALARAADIVVVAPASAHTIAKMAIGMADNLLCAIVLATRATVLVAPAMNVNMWENSATQENVDKLRKRGFLMVGPARGWLAEGNTGYGRMEEPPVIMDTIRQALGRNGDMAGTRLVVTAGGTQEPIDPVRHITNKSSGKMGYAIAEAARDRGATVVLVAAPTARPDPVGIAVVPVCTAEEMFQAVARETMSCDALVMAAAVADYRPQAVSEQKIKKLEQELTLKLVRTRDILGTVTGSFVKVGFAAESSELMANATRKLTEKRLDLIVANDITRSDAGFGSDMNQVVLIGQDGQGTELPLMSKRQTADAILDRVARLVAARRPNPSQDGRPGAGTA